MEIPCVGNDAYRPVCFTQDSLIKKPDDKPDKIYSSGSKVISSYAISTFTVFCDANLNRKISFPILLP